MGYMESDGTSDTRPIDIDRLVELTDACKKRVTDDLSPKKESIMSGVAIESNGSSRKLGDGKPDSLSDDSLGLKIVNTSTIAPELLDKQTDIPSSRQTNQGENPLSGSINVKTESIESLKISDVTSESPDKTFEETVRDYKVEVTSCHGNSIDAVVAMDTGVSMETLPKLSQYSPRCGTQTQWEAQGDGEMPDLKPEIVSMATVPEGHDPDLQKFEIHSSPSKKQKNAFMSSELDSYLEKYEKTTEKRGKEERYSDTLDWEAAHR